MKNIDIEQFLTFNEKTGTYISKIIVECEYFPDEENVVATVLDPKNDEAIKMFNDEEAKLFISILLKDKWQTL